MIGFYYVTVEWIDPFSGLKNFKLFVEMFYEDSEESFRNAKAMAEKDAVNFVNGLRLVGIEPVEIRREVR